MGIRLSKEHGVNPSVMLCYWCGEDVGVVLMGRLKDDAQAPRSSVLDYDPCDDCAAGMDSGITLIEATDNPTGGNEVAIQEGIYPTGKWWVVKESLRAKLEEHLGFLKGATKVFIEPEVAVHAGLYEAEKSNGGQNAD